MNLAAAFLVAVLSMGADNDRVVLNESVDVVELSHFYDEDGRHVLDQLLFYRWNVNRHEMIDWRLVKSPECLPVRHGGHWECFWTDGIQLRRIRCASYRESWEQYDLELADREHNPPERRKKLRAK